MRFVPDAAAAGARQVAPPGRRTPRIAPHSHAWAQVAMSHRRGAHHRRPRHLPGAAVARGVDPARRGARWSRWSRPPSCARCTCTRRRAAACGPACRADGRRRLARLPRARGVGAAARTGAAAGRGAWTAAARCSAAALERERRLGDLVLDELRRAAPVRAGRGPAAGQAPAHAVRSRAATTRSRHATLEGWAREAAPAPRTWRGCSASELGTTFGRLAPAGAAGPGAARWRRRAGRWATSPPSWAMPAPAPSVPWCGARSASRRAASSPPPETDAGARSRWRQDRHGNRALRLHPPGRQRRSLHRPCLGQGARAR